MAFEEYQPFLAGSTQKQRSWLQFSLRVHYSISRVFLVLCTKFLFKMRDICIAMLNVWYLILLFPLDLMVTCVYLCLSFIQMSPGISGRAESPSTRPMADLNVVRRLLWSGSKISAGKRLSNLTVPSTIVVKEPNNDKTWLNGNDKIVDRVPQQSTVSDPSEKYRGRQMSHKSALKLGRKRSYQYPADEPNPFNHRVPLDPSHHRIPLDPRTLFKYDPIDEPAIDNLGGKMANPNLELDEKPLGSRIHYGKRFFKSDSIQEDYDPESSHGALRKLLSRPH